MLPTPIEFLHDWGTHRRGQVVDTISPSDAEVLVMNGIARPAGGLVKPTTATTTVVTGPPAAGAPPKTPRPPKKPKGQ